MPGPRANLSGTTDAEFAVPSVLLLEDSAADPATIGGMTRNGGAIRFRDSLGVYNPRPTGGPSSQPSHLVVSDFTLSASETSTIPRYVEIADGITYEIGDDADLEIG